MTIPAQTDAIITPVVAGEDRGSYVDWPAVIAGIVIALAISIVLLGFGSALGLSMVGFRAGAGVSPVWIAIAAGIWLLWVQISSFMAGGYAAGRLRRRLGDATEDEVDVRDGAHGLLVWAGALVIAAIVAASGISAVAGAVGATAATATNAAATAAKGTGSPGPGGSASSNPVDPTAYFADWLFRPEPSAGGAAAPAAATPAGGDTSGVRAEAGRIFAQSAVTGQISEQDRNYLAQLVSAHSGLTPDQATARVNEVLNGIEQAKAKAAEAAETARKTAVLAAFLTAASLLVSGAGAYWAAQKGGNHRDRNTVFPMLFRRF